MNSPEVKTNSRALHQDDDFIRRSASVFGVSEERIETIKGRYSCVTDDNIASKKKRI